MPVDVPESSDLGQLIDLLEGAGYARLDGDPQYAADPKVYTLTHHESDQTTTYRGHSAVYRWALTLGEGIGYSRFLAEFYFNEDGTLVTHGLWE